MGEILDRAGMQELHPLHTLTAAVYNQQAKSPIWFMLQMVVSLV